MEKSLKRIILFGSLGEEKAEQRKNINSLLIAIFLSTNIIGYAIPINNISVIISVFALIAWVVTNGIKSIEKNKIIFFLGIIVWFFLSLITKNGNTNNISTMFQYFIIFGTTALIISSGEIKEISVCKYILYISFFAVPHMISKNFYIGMSYIGEEAKNAMSVAYGILPIIISSFTVLFQKESKKHERVLSLVICILFTFSLFNMYTRGPILGIIIYLILRLLFYKTKEKKLKIIVIVIACIITIILLLNLENLLLMLKEILIDMNMRSFQLDRFIYKLQGETDFLSGRSKLYDNAINDLKTTFILGNGIASYEDKYNIYVHNIILQIIYEGGIICIGYFIYLMYILIKNLICSEKEKVIFLTFLTSISLPQLMISSCYWGSPKFWILISYLITLASIKKRKKHVKKNDKIFRIGIAIDMLILCVCLDICLRNM